MMTGRTWIATGLTLLLGGAAIAEPNPGTTVYVKVRNTRVFQRPDPTSAMVGKQLQPGDELIWNGRVRHAALSWQQVTVNGKRGYVLGSNLSLTRPTETASADTGAVHLDPSAANDDAVKVTPRGGGAEIYGQNHEPGAKTLRQLETLKLLSAEITDDLVTQHNAALGKEAKR